MKVLSCLVDAKQLYVGFNKQEWENEKLNIVNLEKIKQKRAQGVSNAFEETVEDISAIEQNYGDKLGEFLNAKFSRDDLNDIYMVGIVFMDDPTFISVPFDPHYPVHQFNMEPWQQPMIKEVESFKSLTTIDFKKFVYIPLMEREEFKKMKDRFYELTGKDLDFQIDYKSKEIKSAVYTGTLEFENKDADDEILLFMQYHVDKAIAKSLDRLLNYNAQIMRNATEGLRRQLTEEEKEDHKLFALCNDVLEHFVQKDCYPRIKLILNTSDSFIFLSGNPNDKRPTKYSVIVNKTNKQIKEFKPFSEEGRNILKQAKVIKTPKQFD